MAADITEIYLKRLRFSALFCAFCVREKCDIVKLQKSKKACGLKRSTGFFVAWSGERTLNVGFFFCVTRVTRRKEERGHAHYR